MASDCTYMNMSHACSSHQAVFALEINGVTADLLRLSYMVWSVWSSNGSLRTVWESHGCSFHGGWVHCQHWKLEGSLESCWPSGHVRNQKKLILLSERECSNSIDKLAIVMKASRQSKPFLSTFSYFWAATKRCHPYCGWAFLLQLTQ